MYRRNVRDGRLPGHPDIPPSGWQQVAGLGIVGTVATVTAVLTEDADMAVAVVMSLLPFLPR